MYHAQER